MSVLKLHFLVDLQQKVGELVLSITSSPTYNHYFRKCFKLVYRKHVVITTLTTGISFSS
jgi:hypothetical protein